MWPRLSSLLDRATAVLKTFRSEHDQELDSLLVGPIPVGVNKFLFEADPPNTTHIPDTEILGVTVILLTCSYDGREFVRVGYYVNNEYSDPALNEDPPAKPVIDKVRRHILAEKPRVTRFAIKWDSEESAPAEFPPEQPDVDAADDDGTSYGAEEEEEEEEVEAGEAVAKPADEDAEMEGVETNGKEDESESEAGSEDLEAESEDDDEEELDEEEADAEQATGEDMDVDDVAPSKDAAPADGPSGKHQQPQGDVMVH